MNDLIAELRPRLIQRLNLRMQQMQVSNTRLLLWRAGKAQIRKSARLHPLVAQARRRGDVATAAVRDHSWTLWVN